MEPAAARYHDRLDHELSWQVGSGDHKPKNANNQR